VLVSRREKNDRKHAFDDRELRAQLRQMSHRLPTFISLSSLISSTSPGANALPHTHRSLHLQCFYNFCYSCYRCRHGILSDAFLYIEQLYIRHEVWEDWASGSLICHASPRLALRVAGLFQCVLVVCPHAVTISLRSLVCL
jgi:hypothetical protein